MTTTAPVTSLAVHVRGVVQGVGFRPFVHRLATEYGLRGWVRNDDGEVVIAVAGRPAACDAFLADLEDRAPPLAEIATVTVEPYLAALPDAFTIAPSGPARPDRRQPVPPDAALCSACEAELFDPTNRRFRYPFITCTNCGPRYTVIERMPYDRERTSMRRFEQCDACRREYETPSDRRYHSETNSCPACGPQVEFCFSDGTFHPIHDRPIEMAAALLREGHIVAVRGLGGFHLAVDATQEHAVQRLRRKKARDAKPLAVMVRTAADAERWAEVDADALALLRSRERPIVLLRPRPDAPLAPSVAPGLDRIGIMTAYTPLHHLLLEAVQRPLVMTSGNRSEEPIAIDNGDALRRLGDIADAFLLHDRHIVARYDDSVVRCTRAGPIILRRARGLAPLPVALPVATPYPLLAVGPHLKNTLTLAQDARAFVSPHIGDLENLETLDHFRDALARLQDLFAVEPRAVARDLHPGYLSTRIAEELGLEHVVTVQHHHAHVAAVAAEHGVTTPVVGVAFDGTGYGDDGTVWGGEVLIADLRHYRRWAHLQPAPLPGGDLAARRPWRSALGYLSLAPDEAAAFRPAFEGVDLTELRVAEQQILRSVNAPPASSMGRLFDTAAAILGVRRVSYYEGQAAMELEALAGDRPGPPLPYDIVAGPHGTHILDPIPLLVALGQHVRAGADPADLAARFHETIAHATAALARDACDAASVTTVVLSGGVFQNARLLTGTAKRIRRAGLTLLVPRLLGPNDGAVSYGQAAVAAARLACTPGG